MRQYMVIETFIGGSPGKGYERFHRDGRMCPAGLTYLDSWLSSDGTRCFQLMETQRPELFREWIERWQDLVRFEIVEIGEKPPATS